MGSIRKVVEPSGEEYMKLCGMRGARIYLNIKEGHFYRYINTSLVCTDIQFFTKFSATAEEKKLFACAAKPGQTHSHPIPTREVVEIALIRWACKLRILQSCQIKESLSQSIKFVLASWPQSHILSTIQQTPLKLALHRFKLHATKENCPNTIDFLEEFGGQTFDRFRQVFYTMPYWSQPTPGSIGVRRNLFRSPTKKNKQSPVKEMSNHKTKVRDVCDQFYEKSLLNFEEALAEYGKVFKKITENCDKTKIVIDNAERIRAVADRLFEVSRLEKWLRHKLDEFDMIRKITDVKKTVAFISELQLQEQLNYSSKKSKVLTILHIPPLDVWTKKSFAQFEQFKTEDGTLVIDDEDVPWHMVEEKRKEILEQIGQLANHVEMNKEWQKRVFIQFNQNPKEFGCWYTVYKDGQVLMDNIIGLLDPPTGLCVRFLPLRKSNEETTVILKWKYKDMGQSSHFLMEYRHANTIRWKQYRLPLSNGLDETRVNFSYKRELVVEFRVAAETCIGLSQFTPIIDTRNLIEITPTKSKPSRENVPERTSNNSKLTSL